MRPPAVGAVLPELEAGQTLRSALLQMSASFAAAGLPTPREDAKFILQGLLECDGATLIRDANVPVGAAVAALNEAVRRRLSREPVSRILGWREFYGRRFVVTPDVLDPRSDTETIIDLSLEVLAARRASNEGLTIVDVGTGSGAIIITLLAELPNVRGIATDISEAALDVARRNAVALGVADRLTLVRTSGLDRVTINESCALIVSNPPYIPTADVATLERDVKDYDPLLALDGGADGLAIYRDIAACVSANVNCPPIVLELGVGMAEDVVSVFGNAGFLPIFSRTDLGGHIRAVALQLRP